MAILQQIRKNTKTGIMSEIAIKAENISKVYKLYNSPRDRFKESLHPFRRKYHHDFYALRDISFEIKKGETLGIIGKNGSGKSTLLKIITGVLTPSSGNVQVNGRVSALLELGAGFNPELSGLENVYFQGAIMGYTKTEMDAKVDEILSFADIGEFVNQPVKNYSSGMYVRLAFSVAIMVDPDILIVDEALAVGDMRFQQKCIRKMRSFMEAGKTVIFVTHDTGIVNNFCMNTIWLDDGKIKDYGASEGITKKYVSFMSYGLETNESGLKEVEIENAQTTPQNSDVEILNNDWIDTADCEYFGTLDAVISCIMFLNRETGQSVSVLEGGERVSFYLKVQINKDILSPGIGLLIKDRLGNAIFTINNYIYNISFGEFEKSTDRIVKYDFNMPKLSNGEYSITAALSDGDQYVHEQLCWLHDILFFKINSKQLCQQIGTVFALEKNMINLECL